MYSYFRQKDILQSIYLKWIWYYKYKYNRPAQIGYGHKFRASHFVRHCRHQSDPPLLFAISSGRANYYPNRRDCWAKMRYLRCREGTPSTPRELIRMSPHVAAQRFTLKAMVQGRRHSPTMAISSTGLRRLTHRLPQAVDANESWELNALYQDSGR